MQLLGGVKIESDRNAEPIAQRRGEEPGAGGGADQGEMGEVNFHRARRRPRADDEIELEILHRRIQNLFHSRIEAMNLIDEQDVARFKVGELRRQIPALGDHRPRGRAEIDPELARHDLRQRRLAESRRTDEQHMIERFAARFGRLDEDAEILARRLLAGEIGQELRAYRRLVLGALVGRDETGRVVGHLRRPRPVEKPPARARGALSGREGSRPRRKQSLRSRRKQRRHGRASLRFDQAKLGRSFRRAVSRDRPRPMRYKARGTRRGRKRSIRR